MAGKGAVVEENKTCSTCLEDKPVTFFSFRTSARTRRDSRCNPCRNRAYYSSAKTRDRNMLRLHGLTSQDIADRLAEQGDCCATCGATEPGDSNWHVDHDHACCASFPTCGRCTRGILCRRCNMALGDARDDPALLRRLADYIEEHRR